MLVVASFHYMSIQIKRYWHLSTCSFFCPELFYFYLCISGGLLVLFIMQSQRFLFENLFTTNSHGSFYFTSVLSISKWFLAWNLKAKCWRALTSGYANLPCVFMHGRLGTLVNIEAKWTNIFGQVLKGSPHLSYMQPP